MISLQAVNQAICALYQKALNAAGTGAELVAEDVSKPIIRPSGKVELEDGTDARLLASGRERTVTFRLYYFAKDRDRPKLENLAVRSAIGEAFLDGITVEDTYLGIDEGVSFTVTDGLLVASLELTLTEPVPEDPDTAVGAGKFLLINDDDEVRVGVDVNALTTTNGTTLTDDMKYIETVEAMDMLRDDITATFRDEYLGKYRNSKANQMLFISAVNYYFDTLAAAASNYVLNPDHDNKAGIDVTAQRNAWIGSGKAEAADWDDATVMATPFKRMVYLSGDVQILGCMGGLEFAVTLM